LQAIVAPTRCRPVALQAVLVAKVADGVLPPGLLWFLSRALHAALRSFTARW
jgi:hypothetical protein